MHTQHTTEHAQTINAAESVLSQNLKELLLRLLLQSRISITRKTKY